MSTINSTALVIQFEGYEEVTFWKKCLSKRRRYLKKLVRKTSVADLKFDLSKFVDNFVPRTPLAHPFGIYLPNYLPPSVTL